MSDTQKDSTSNISFLDLPDEELAKYSADGSLAVAAAADSGEGAPAGDAVVPGEQDQAKVEDQAETGKEEGAGEEKPADAQGSESGEAKPEPAKEPQGEAKPADEAKKEEKVEADPEKKDPPAVDFEAEYKKLFAPIKANGREMSIDSVEDARTLMQMGANYNKKMAALKPNLAILKMLENNGLLNEEKLSYLIDLDKKDPAAINKLIKDSGIDPMDLDAEKAGAYKPTNRKVDHRELELDSVLESIQDSKAYARTLEVVSKEWDGASKQVIADEPQLLKVINAHIESGIYDLISTEMERERALGRLQGMSDIQAYRQVGDAINARGGFAHLGRQEQQTPTKQVVTPPAPKKEEEDKRNEKKRAAAPAKPAAASNAPAQDFNPLALSDDEFAKLPVKYR